MLQLCPSHSATQSMTADMRIHSKMPGNQNQCPSGVIMAPRYDYNKM